MREIKFRIYNPKVKEIGETFTLIQAMTDEFILSDDLIYMQYTGLKDKNGKEAYQGDIFRPWEDNRIYQIVWNDDYARFECKQLGGKRWPCEMLMVAYSEIIDNIMENPELVK